NLPPALRPVIDVFDTDKELILGMKKKTAQDKIQMAKMSIVNLDAGTKKASSQKPAGGTPDRILIDEALSEDEVVITKDGLKKISSVSTGDYIYDHNGLQTKILDKIDVGVKQLYGLKLNNDVVIEACEDHLWEVKNKFKNANNIEIKSTKELIKDFK